jgi:hypothetical protein
MKTYTISTKKKEKNFRNIFKLEDEVFCPKNGGNSVSGSPYRSRR